MSKTETEKPHERKYCWGIREISDEAERTPRQMYHMVKRGELKCVRKKGGLYFCNRGALRRELDEVVS
jgi:hypothetical protein